MAVLGQTPTRVHYVDSESITWIAGADYVDPNDPTKLVRDLEAHEQELQLYAADTGAANAHAITLSPAPTIVAGTKFVIKAAHANSGASTLAVNGAGAVAIKKNVSAALVGGEILAGQIFEVTYDGTNFQLAHSAPILKTDDLSASCNSSTTSFTLSATPQQFALVVWNGQVRFDYSQSGTSLTTTFTPDTGDKLYALYFV